MKNILLLFSGLAAAAVYYLATRPVTRPHVDAPEVTALAHKLESAWADHHTVA